MTFAPLHEISDDISSVEMYAGITKDVTALIFPSGSQPIGDLFDRVLNRLRHVLSELDLTQGRLPRVTHLVSEYKLPTKLEEARPPWLTNERIARFLAVYVQLGCSCPTD